MLLKNAIKCPRLAESAVLYAVQRQTLCEPYAFTGVKWATIKLSVASNRDLCYFDKMGLVRQTSGKRMAYHVMQSVDLAEYPHKAKNKRVQMSLCYVLEELEDDLVGVYMQGEMNYSAMSCFATPAVSEMLLAIANTLECTRAKKLLLMMSRPGGLRNNSSQKNCAYCKGSSSFFESLENCAGCNKHVCKKCRSSEHVLARGGCHLKRAEFCRKCTYKTSKSSLDQVAIEASGYNAAGLAHKASFITIEEETEDAKVDIHGSDRSLTSFVRKISAQMQELSTPGDFRASSLSLIGGLSEDEEREGEDVLNASRLKSGAFMVLDSHLPSRSRSSRTSTASSSYGRDEEDPEQFHATLFARLQQVSQQAEETWFLAREQSIVANSVRQRSQRRAQSYA
ncbi:unnamed protein product [Phytophthora lilii]|uniref:Unnamed protein product n=1 Tax=Phytophthora lilii TaxID=2077276 RepID=A0A9W6TDA6_9STRA|nr:unnamed protein product [Phytophthora lilii]